MKRCENCLHYHDTCCCSVLEEVYAIMTHGECAIEINDENLEKVSKFIAKTCNRWEKWPPS